METLIFFRLSNTYDIWVWLFFCCLGRCVQLVFSWNHPVDAHFAIKTGSIEYHGVIESIGTKEEERTKYTYDECVTVCVRIAQSLSTIEMTTTTTTPTRTSNWFQLIDKLQRKCLVLISFPFTFTLRLFSIDFFHKGIIYSFLRIDKIVFQERRNEYIS